MQFMVMVKTNEKSEAGELPSPELMAAMAKLNDEMVKAGVFVSAAGLRPTSAGMKVKFEGKRRTVVDGPFAEAKELIGGYWILQVKSREEVLEWVKKVPFEEGEIEIRRISEPADFQR